MQGVVQTEASHGLDVGRAERGEQMTDVSGLTSHIVRAEDVAFDDVSLLRFGKVSNTVRQNGISVISVAVFGNEAKEALVELASYALIAVGEKTESTVVLGLLTENLVIVKMI